MAPGAPEPALARRPFPRLRASAERLALIAACSLGAAWVHEHHDPGVLCPLRRITGVPCPLCGSTTVFMAAGSGHWYDALTANPVTALGALLFLAVPLRSADPLRFWAGLPRAWRLWPLVLLAAVSWLWQLHRYGFL